MSEKNKTEIITIDNAEKVEVVDEHIIKLTKTYQFEGETIAEIDMSGLDNITANDLIKAGKVLQAAGTVTVMPETNLEYTLIVASGATGKPVEFFKGLVPRDAMKVKNAVTSFFFGEE